MKTYTLETLETRGGMTEHNCCKIKYRGDADEPSDKDVHDAFAQMNRYLPKGTVKITRKDDHILVETTVEFDPHRDQSMRAKWILAGFIFIALITTLAILQYGR